MTRILVTGGAGELGRSVVDRLEKTGSTVRVMSRKAKPEGVTFEWSQADVLNGNGIESAVANVDVIVNCMSNPRQDTHAVDVDGTRLLLDKARSAGVAHILHVSIVGIDGMPYSYYQEKVAAEAVVKACGIPWSILRATQFHSFIDFLLSKVPVYFSLMPLPTDFKVQSIDTGEVADYLVKYVTTPSGMLPDVGGPEVLTGAQMAHAWLSAQGLHRLIAPLPLIGKVPNGLRHGFNTCPDQRIGKITWAEWLKQKYGPQTEYGQRKSAVMS